MSAKVPENQPEHQESQKTALRKHCLEERKNPPLPDVTPRLLEQLSNWEVFQTVRQVLAYTPFQQEVSLLPHIEQYPDKHWYFPVSKRDSTMEFYRQQAEEHFQVGLYGILEPDTTGKKPLSEFTEPILALIPGLAFSHSGYRLGYGKGYYDRWIQKYRSSADSPATIRLAGVLESRFLRTDIPISPWDKRMDYLVTETGIVSCHNSF